MVDRPESAKAVRYRLRAPVCGASVPCPRFFRRPPACRLMTNSSADPQAHSRQDEGRWSAPAVFGRLGGAWTFERTISNQANMTGQARFLPGQGDHLRYEESGTLVLPTGQAIQAHRSYLYFALENGFSVWFDEPEPRLFHEVRLAAAGDVLRGSATHPCGQDQYDTVYEFRPDGSFMIRHDVKGPRKDYVSVTVFRQDGSPSAQ